MTRKEIEQAYEVRCEQVCNPYTEDRHFWVVKDQDTEKEIGRCASLDDVVTTLNVIKDFVPRN